MSQKKARAQEKAAEEQRYFPEFGEADLASRAEIAHAFVHLVQEALTVLPTTEMIPDNGKAMWGAHLTIAHYVGERLLAFYQRERELVERRSDIVRITSPLVGLDGNPIGGGSGHVA